MAKLMPRIEAGCFFRDQFIPSQSQTEHETHGTDKSRESDSIAEHDAVKREITKEGKDVGFKIEGSSSDGISQEDSVWAVSSYSSNNVSHFIMEMLTLWRNLQE